MGARTADVVTITCVKLNGQLHPPGTRLTAAAALAAELVALGAARLVVRERLEEVDGIGQATAEALRTRGVPDLAALAALTDDELETYRVRPEWRDQARQALSHASDDVPDAR